MFNQSVSWVDARPFRAHLKDIVSQTGLPWRVVAIASRVPESTVKRLISSDRRPGKIRHCDAQTIISIDPEELIGRAKLQVFAAYTKNLADLLLDSGISLVRLAEFLGLSNQEITALLTTNIWCRLETQWRAQAACSAHQLIWDDLSLRKPQPLKTAIDARVSEPQLIQRDQLLQRELVAA